uniref:Uncharacterized protein n=1 Tax=Arundo donax TaxID=35708 RepID=A0A0A9CRD5_ARUDO
MAAGLTPSRTNAAQASSPARRCTRKVHPPLRASEVKPRPLGGTRTELTSSPPWPSPRARATRCSPASSTRPRPPPP